MHSEVAFVAIDKIITKNSLYYNYLGNSTRSERTLLLRALGPPTSIGRHGESWPSQCGSVGVESEVLTSGGDVGEMDIEEGKVNNLHGQEAWGSFRERCGSKSFRGSSFWNRKIEGGKENLERFPWGYN